MQGSGVISFKFDQSAETPKFLTRKRKLYKIHYTPQGDQTLSFLQVKLIGREWLRVVDF